MRKWFLYSAVVILSFSIFFACFLQTSYRKMSFQHDLSTNGKSFLALNKVYLQSLFKHDITDVFLTMKTSVLTKAKKSNAKLQNEITSLKKTTHILKAIAVTDISVNTKKNNFTKSTCNKTLLSTNNPNEYIVCNTINNKNVFLIVDVIKIKSIMNRIYEKKAKEYFSLPLMLFYFDNKILYLNTPLYNIYENQTIIKKVTKLLNEKKQLQFILYGRHIFIDKLEFNSPYLENFYLFLGVLPNSLPFTQKDILFLSIVGIFCLLLLLLGLFYVYYFYRNSSSIIARDPFSGNTYNPYSITQPIENEDLTQKNKTLKREYKELRELINELKAQENKYAKVINEEPSLNAPVSYAEKIENLKNLAGHNTWDYVLNLHPEIDYTLKCTEIKNDVEIEGIDQYGNRLTYTMEKSGFYFPLLVKKGQSFYIYKEAGKTSPIKKLLAESSININLIEGALVVPMTINNTENYIIHLFSREVDHVTYSNIYRETKKVL